MQRNETRDDDRQRLCAAVNRITDHEGRLELLAALFAAGRQGTVDRARGGDRAAPGRELPLDRAAGVRAPAGAGVRRARGATDRSGSAGGAPRPEWSHDGPRSSRAPGGAAPRHLLVQQSRLAGPLLSGEPPTGGVPRALRHDPRHRGDRRHLARHPLAAHGGGLARSRARRVHLRPQGAEVDHPRPLPPGLRRGLEPVSGAHGPPRGEARAGAVPVPVRRARARCRRVPDGQRLPPPARAFPPAASGGDPLRAGGAQPGLDHRVLPRPPARDAAWLWPSPPTRRCRTRRNSWLVPTR